jgi:hypothetical protein
MVLPGRIELTTSPLPRDYHLSKFQIVSVNHACSPQFFHGL